jgi:hypothetical protein
MPKPAGNSRDVNAAFNADGGEEMAKIVMGDPRHSDDSGRARHGFLALVNEKHFITGAAAGLAYTMPLSIAMSIMWRSRATVLL